MEREPILLTPGPTIVPERVREAMARPMIHHRTPEFQAMLQEAASGLKLLFGTTQEPLILASSGTGAMEAAVVNLLCPGETALVIRAGKFGERWGEICQAHGIRVVPFDSAWGRSLDLEAFGEAFRARPEIRAVFATLCETSTGAVYPIRAIREAMGQTQALLAVDAISGLGADPFVMDEWGVDAAVCGSQKSLMLPPGLSCVALSARAWERAEAGGGRSYYFDLKRARKAWEKTDTPFTPAVNLVRGLVESLNLILGDGLECFLESRRALSDQVRKAVERMGLELFTDPSCASRAVTAVRVPEGVDGKVLLKRLKEEHRVFFAGGQGRLSGKIFRIATLGAVGEKEIRAGLSALGQVLGSARAAGVGPR